MGSTKSILVMSVLLAHKPWKQTASHALFFSCSKDFWPQFSPYPFHTVSPIICQTASNHHNCTLIHLPRVLQWQQSSCVDICWWHHLPEPNSHTPVFSGVRLSAFSVATIHCDTSFQTVPPAGNQLQGSTMGCKIEAFLWRLSWSFQRQAPLLGGAHALIKSLPLPVICSKSYQLTKFQPTPCLTNVRKSENHSEGHHF